MHDKQDMTFLRIFFCKKVTNFICENQPEEWCFLHTVSKCFDLLNQFLDQDAEKEK